MERATPSPATAGRPHRAAPRAAAADLARQRGQPRLGHAGGRTRRPALPRILGGTPEHWARYGAAYRAAWEQMGHPAEDADIAVAVHGFVAEENRRAKTDYLDFELRMMREGMAEIGRPGSGPPPSARAGDLEPGGMVYAGGPEEVAERILHLQELLGHSRQILQMDVGGMPHATYLRAIELLGTEVFPRVRAELDRPG